MRKDVDTAYRLILGRPPESEAAIAGNLVHADIWHLIKVLLESDEFKQHSNKKSSDYYDLPWRRLAPGLSIDCEIPSEEVYARLENRIRQSWNSLGAQEPYFSVVTDRRFLTSEQPVDRQAFYDLGNDDAALVRSTLARAGVDIATLHTCIEYGCGAGRATWKLAALFDKVIALDVSAAHIEVRRQWLTERGIQNVELRTINRLTSIYEADHDFWFSRIVLQHNPPPLIIRIVSQALSHLRPGGIALFQVPTYNKGYKFDLNEYLATIDGPGQMEMHCIPQPALLGTITSAGCDLIEIVED